MDRLTTYKTECNREMICRYEDCDICEEYCPHLQEDNCLCLQGVLEKLGQYEDAEEQGLLLRLPCKVGDVIYEINNGKIVEHCLRSKWRIARYMEEGIFGVLAFTTREEAEQALATMKGGAEC